MKLFVAIATVGRAGLVEQLVDRLLQQRRKPDGIILVGTAAADVAGLGRKDGEVELHLSEKGLCKQRNLALDKARSRADLILFFDDDFVPANDYLCNAERIFERHADIVGATGRIVADGIKGAGYSFSDAVRLVDEDAMPVEDIMHPAEALYGCNMVLRTSALEGLRFDEALPLYGWLEDIDFTFRLGRRGRLIRSPVIRGAHMGVKSGRTSGIRLGYSQIANPIHLLAKQSTPRGLAFRLMARNVAANLVRSAWPESYIDRRGRLRGNLIAMAHVLTGQLDPRHILNLR